ncbi:MAG: hypothetical protein ACFE9I_03215 [Candidatus Hermodarchaeota archaeon]
MSSKEKLIALSRFILTTNREEIIDMTFSNFNRLLSDTLVHLDEEI